MTMYGQPSCTSASMARTTLGWSRSPTIFISRKNRETDVLSNVAVGQDHLEGDHAIHQAVPRLEDPAPRPLADVVEQGIATEGKALLPHHEPTGLELGERPVLDELMGQGQRIVMFRRVNESVPHLPPFLIGQDSRPFERREKLGSRRDASSRPSSLQVWRDALRLMTRTHPRLIADSHAFDAWRSLWFPFRRH